MLHYRTGTVFHFQICLLYNQNSFANLYWYRSDTVVRYRSGPRFILSTGEQILPKLTLV